MRKFLLILIVGCCLTNVSAQTNSFTLDEAVSYALKNNSASKNASSDLEIAQAKK